MNRTRGNCGSAMVLVMGFLMVLMIGSVAFFTLLNNTLDNQYRVERRQVCLNLAESGIDKALAELRAGHLEYKGEQNAPLGDGRFTVTVRPATQPNTYEIDATGSVGAERSPMTTRRVCAHVTLGADGRVREMQWTEARR